MRIGVPSEIKADEGRVALTPDAVAELVRGGHEVWIQRGAGRACRLDDAAYRSAGAGLAADAAELWGRAELIVKVKEPQPSEVALMRPGQLVFAYLHLAANPHLAVSLAEAGVTAVAYEGVRDSAGRLPLLAPMSEIAGRLSIGAAAYHSAAYLGGSGRLLSGAAGVPPAHVVVLGAGVAGTNAVTMAVGMGARVSVADISPGALRRLEERFSGRVETHYATAAAVRRLVTDADVVIGAVLVPGARTPHLVDRRTLADMRDGTVVVDIAIDQGGCFETSRPTTHSDPTFVVDGVLHYCVANMPGAVPVTATAALSNATLPYVMALASDPRAAMAADEGLAAGLEIDGRRICRDEIRKLTESAA